MKSILYKRLDAQYTVQINTNVLTMVTLGPPKVSMYESIIMYIVHTKNMKEVTYYGIPKPRSS